VGHCHQDGDIANSTALWKELQLASIETCRTRLRRARLRRTDTKGARQQAGVALQEKGGAAPARPGIGRQSFTLPAQKTVRIP